MIIEDAMKNKKKKIKSEVVTLEIGDYVLCVHSACCRDFPTVWEVVSADPKSSLLCHGQVIETGPTDPHGSVGYGPVFFPWKLLADDAFQVLKGGRTHKSHPTIDGWFE